VPAPNTVAVLYFDNLTRDSAYTYLADGLSEELISRLGQVRRLDVKSRFESRRVRERRDAGTAELGRSLNVTYLLSGSVQSVGGRIRVSVELVRTPTGARVWSDVLNHAGSDLLGAQEEIVRSVVLAVVGQLLPEERVVLGRRVTRDSAAYDLYLRGRFFFSRHTQRDLQRAIELYEQALGRDSSFALGWAGIAQVWGWLADDFSPPLEAYPRVREAAERSLALDSTVALAHLALAYTAQMLDLDFARAETLARRAVASDPRLADAYAFLSYLLLQRGRPTDALEVSRQAWELDSLSAVVATSRFLTLTGLDLPEEALRLARSVREREVGDATFWALLEAQASILVRDCEGAREILSDIHPRGPRFYWTEGLMAACLDRVLDARVALDSLAAVARRAYVAPTWFATVHAALGDIDEAFEWLERGYEGRDFFVLFVTSHPWWLVHIQADPRFPALMLRIGLPWPAPELPN
jgi:TolB-like protein/tetratricopeptide (TPR) repeat protein